MPRKRVTQDEVNVYLDRLRETGITNMYGATPFVERAFGLDRNRASEMLGVWMRTFAERHPRPEAK